MPNRSAEKVVTGEDGDKSAETRERSIAEVRRVAREVVLGAAGRYGVHDVLTRRFCTDDTDTSTELSRIVDEFLEDRGYDGMDDDEVVDDLNREKLLEELDNFVEKYFGSRYEDATRDTPIMKAYKKLDETIRVLADYDAQHGTSLVDELMTITGDFGDCWVNIHEVLTDSRSSGSIEERHELIAHALADDDGVIAQRLAELERDNDDFDFDEAKAELEQRREHERMSYIRRGMARVFGDAYLGSLVISGRKCSECANLAELRDFAETSALDKAFSGDDLFPTSANGELRITMPADEDDSEGYPGGPVKLIYSRETTGDPLRPHRIGVSRYTEDGRAARGMQDYVALHGSNGAMEIEENLMFGSDDCPLSDAQKEEAHLLTEIADLVAKRANMDGDDATRPFNVDLMLFLEERQIDTESPLFLKAMACGCRAMEAFRARRNASGGIGSENFRIVAVAGEADAEAAERAHGRFFSRKQFDAVAGKIRGALHAFGNWAMYHVPLIPDPYLAINEARYNKKKERERGYSTKVVTLKNPFSVLPSVTDHDAFAKALEERGISQTDSEYTDIANACEVWNGLSGNMRISILSGFDREGVFPPEVTKAIDVLSRHDLIRPNADSTGQPRMVFDDPVVSGRPHLITIYREQIRAMLKGKVDEGSIDSVSRSIEESVRAWNDFLASHHEDAVDLLNRRLDIDDESKISPDLRRSLSILEHNGLLKRAASPFERCADRDAAFESVSRWHEITGFNGEVDELNDDELDAEATKIRLAMKLRRINLGSFLKSGSEDFESEFSDLDLSAAFSDYGGEFIDNNGAHNMLRAFLLTRGEDSVRMMEMREGSFADLDAYLDSLGLSDADRDVLSERLQRYEKFVSKGLTTVPEEEEFDLFQDDPDDRMPAEEILERARRVPELEDAVNNCPNFVDLYNDWLAEPASVRARVLRVDRAGKYEHFLTIIEGVDGATKDKAPKPDGLFADAAAREAAKTMVDGFMAFFGDGTKSSGDLSDFELVSFSADVEKAKASAVDDVREALKNKTTASLSDLQIAAALGLSTVAEVNAERSLLVNMPRGDAANRYAAKMKGRYLSMLEYGSVDADDYFSSVESVADSIRDRCVATLDGYKKYVEAGLIQLEQKYHILVSAGELCDAADAKDAADSKLVTDPTSMRARLNACGDIDGLKAQWDSVPVMDKVRFVDTGEDAAIADDNLREFIAIVKELGCLVEEAPIFASDAERQDAKDTIAQYGELAGLSSVDVDDMSDEDLKANLGQVLARRETAKEHIREYLNGSKRRVRDADIQMLETVSDDASFDAVGDMIDNVKYVIESGKIDEIKTLADEFTAGSEPDLEVFIKNKGHTDTSIIEFYKKYVRSFLDARELGLV